MFNLGKRLRGKFMHLLPDDGIYNTNNMTIMSSSAERCLMSAQAFLAGFLPPNKTTNRLSLLWQPVAVNSIPRDRDKVNLFCKELNN